MSRNDLKLTESSDFFLLKMLEHLVVGFLETFLENFTLMEYNNMTILARRQEVLRQKKLLEITKKAFKFYCKGILENIFQLLLKCSFEYLLPLSEVMHQFRDPAILD